ncbi:hypothetical protein FB558_6105 [Pseudonocardia kunmingensis]|uniref:Uncharacterized protein n=1 Tax=Pseudonocardia kunmingensis TaxID=630975 RepID=A0A543D963_9PSEU|nr:hypothetical protein FB558_6105 [Pseudonocardia kunmingensis]
MVLPAPGGPLTTTSVGSEVTPVANQDADRYASDPSGAVRIARDGEDREAYTRAEHDLVQRVLGARQE